MIPMLFVDESRIILVLVEKGKELKTHSPVPLAVGIVLFKTNLISGTCFRSLGHVNNHINQGSMRKGLCVGII